MIPGYCEVQNAILETLDIPATRWNLNSLAEHVHSGKSVFSYVSDLDYFWIYRPGNEAAFQNAIEDLIDERNYHPSDRVGLPYDILTLLRHDEDPRGLALVRGYLDQLISFRAFEDGIFRGVESPEFQKIPLEYGELAPWMFFQTVLLTVENQRFIEAVRKYFEYRGVRIICANSEESIRNAFASKGIDLVVLEEDQKAVLDLAIEANPLDILTRTNFILRTPNTLKVVRKMEEIMTRNLGEQRILKAA